MSNADTGFSLQRFSTLAGISESHFWFAGRQALIRRVLDRHITRRVAKALDVGCGPGIWLPSWRRYAQDVCGIDPHAGSVDPVTLSEGTTMITGLASHLPVKDGAADIILALDVLEHVDDHAALREMHRALCPGGYVLITVPAFPWLWSYRDDDAGHLRRYTRRTLLAAIGDAGLELRHVQYYNSLLFPAVVLSRFLGRRSAAMRDAEDHPPAWANRIMRRINLFEANSGIRFPFGSTLLALAQKTP
jgi:SAM-dependent methyltransferase